LDRDRAEQDQRHGPPGIGPEYQPRSGRERQPGGRNAEPGKCRFLNAQQDQAGDHGG
jgi:hypothetical protein